MAQHKTLHCTAALKATSLDSRLGFTMQIHVWTLTLNSDSFNTWKSWNIDKIKSHLTCTFNFSENLWIWDFGEPCFLGTVFQASVTLVNFSKMNLGDLYFPQGLHITGHIEIWPLTARRLVTMAARTLQCTGTGSSLLQRQGKLFLPWEIKHFNLNLLLSY